MAVKEKIVIGLGNPILSDDGVGIFAAREVKKNLPPDSRIDVVEASLAGFNLLDLMLGYKEAVIIDSIQTKDGKVGEIYEFTPDALVETIRLASVHDFNMATALKFGKMMGMDVPGRVTIYAVEVADNSTFYEGCCREVENAIPEVVEKVLQDLE